MKTTNPIQLQIQNMTEYSSSYNHFYILKMIFRARGWNRHYIAANARDRPDAQDGLNCVTGYAAVNVCDRIGMELIAHGCMMWLCKPLTFAILT